MGLTAQLRLMADDIGDDLDKAGAERAGSVLAGCSRAKGGQPVARIGRYSPTILRGGVKKDDKTLIFRVGVGFLEGFIIQSLMYS